MIIETLKEVLLTIGMFVGCIIVLPVIMDRLLYIFAKVTYALAHKNVKKAPVRKSNIIFDIDSKNKTLQEIQAERFTMMKILGGF
jgi:hypothetical protein